MSEVGVLVTGATGFVGSKLVEVLSLDEKYSVKTLSRREGSSFNKFVVQFLLNDFNECEKNSEYFKDVKTVIHCAARAHITDAEKEESSLVKFREVNVLATLAIAKAAADSGVKRFIFLSSVKVNGESTAPGEAFRESDKPNPQDSYGISKYEAEQELLKLGKSTGMEIVIIRPPLVYGPGVKANLKSLINLANKGIPLPLGKIKNKRSMISLNNLVDFIKICIDNPKAKNEIFLVSDGEEISITDLIKKASKGRAVLFYLPATILEILFTLIGKKSFNQKILGSLVVEPLKAKDLLGWEPPGISTDELFEI